MCCGGGVDSADYCPLSILDCYSLHLINWPVAAISLICTNVVQILEVSSRVEFVIHYFLLLAHYVPNVAKEEYMRSM